MLNESLADNRNYAYFPITVEAEFPMSRDALYMKLMEQNVYSRKYFYPLTLDQACFKNKYREIKVKNARELSEKILVLPIYARLDIEKVVEICGVIKQ